MNRLVRLGTIDDMLDLWGYRDKTDIPNTVRFLLII